MASNTAWMLVAHGVRTIMQAGYFILIARALGTSGYGAFIGVVALIAVASPFSTWGSGNVLIKHVSRDPSSFPIYWGNALVATFISGSLLLGLSIVIARVALPPSVRLDLVFYVGLSDLIFARLTDLSGQAFQALQQLRRTAECQVYLIAFRLLAAALLYGLVQSPTASDWAVFYLISSVGGAAVSLTLVRRKLGKGVRDVRRIPGEMKEGFYFAMGLSAQGIYNDIDKTMMAKLTSLEVTGAYGAAYRIIDVVFTPVRSLLAAAYPRFFQRGAQGVEASTSYARRLLFPSMIYAICSGFLIYAAAPLLPLILGEQYRPSIGAVRWLASLPALKTGHFLAADSLSGLGFQGLRTGIQISIAILNIAMNAVMIPKYSWRGAAWASLTSDGLLLVVLWIILIRKTQSATHAKRENESRQS